MIRFLSATLFLVLFTVSESELSIFNAESFQSGCLVVIYGNLRMTDYCIILIEVVRLHREWFFSGWMFSKILLIDFDD